jgi:hypothetical protein
MAPAAAFVEVLEHVVNRSGSGEPAAARRWHPGIATRPLLWLEATAVGPRRGALSLDSAERRAPRIEAPRRPRTFSPLQRDAFDRLQAFGARLHPAFTRTELRSAFRSLARTFHPDHHPAMSTSEKARLSATFRQVRRDYDVLKNIIWGA